MKDWNEIIRQKLSQEEFPFQEEHWEDLERRLPGRRRRFLPWSAAASLLLLLGVLWMYAPKRELAQKSTPPAVGKMARKDSTAATETKEVVPEAAANGMKPSPASNQLAEASALPLLTAHEGKNTILNTGKSTEYAAEKSQAGDLSQEAMHLVAGRSRQLPLMSARMPNTVESLSLPEIPVPSYAQPLEKLPRVHTPKPFRSSLALVAAPDLTSVQGAGTARFSTNVGLLYTYTFHKRWSASTGVLYARKNYASPYSFYQPDTPLAYTPTDVRAVCQVLAVPLAINYTAWEKKNQSLQLTAGASTYFMLSEKYSMNYANNYSHDYEFKGKNQHYFGVADLSFTYLRRVNKQYSLGIRPFVQLPLQGIGYGNIPLQSQGVALIIGLNP